MIGADADDDVGRIAGSGAVTLEKRDPLIEAAGDRGCPPAVETRPGGVDTEARRFGTGGHRAQQQFSPTTAQVQDGSRPAGSQVAGDRISPRT